MELDLKVLGPHAPDGAQPEVAGQAVGRPWVVACLENRVRLSQLERRHADLTWYT